MTRQQANFDILAILHNHFSNYPDIRFGQALFNLGLIERATNSFLMKDPFYKESKEMLEQLQLNPPTPEPPTEERVVFIHSPDGKSITLRGDWEQTTAEGVSEHLRHLADQIDKLDFTAPSSNEENGEPKPSL